MSLGKKITITIVSLLMVTCLPAAADVPDDVEVLRVSGGEKHTLVVTAAGTVWATGDNTFYQLGTGDDNDEWTLDQVLAGDMNSPSEYLEDIIAVAAGYTHSLALDVNGFVWAWGSDSAGQLGNGTPGSSATPVQVHGPNDVNFLEDIVVISAGRSGYHSLAVDVNGANGLLFIAAAGNLRNYENADNDEVPRYPASCNPSPRQPKRRKLTWTRYSIGWMRSGWTIPT
jgi:alpha-tubulin suppressor-like RCC1 family protein